MDECSDGIIISESIIEMNLQKVIRSLKELDRQHQIIKHKFSSKQGNGYVYKNCLQRDEMEDLRIYGHTHADTISKFRTRHQTSVHEYESECSLAPRSKTAARPTPTPKPITRSQTAHRDNRRRNCILETYTIDRSRAIHKAATTCATSLTHTKHKVISQDVCLRKESIAKFRKQFSTQFEENLQIAKCVSLKKRTKQKAKTIIVDPNHKQSKCVVPEKQNENVFLLTQNKEIVPHNIQILQASSSIQSAQLKRLNQFIFSPFSTNFLENIRKGNKNWSQCWKNTRNLKDLDCLSFILVSISNMTVYQITSHELVRLGEVLQEILTKQKIVHLYILKTGINSGQELVYEEFIASKSISLQFFSWPKEIFRYYLRRFMFLTEDNIEVSTINQQQKQFHEDYQKIPKSFYRFIHEMKEKSYILVDFKLNRSTGNLCELLEEGFKQIEARRLNWSKKGILFERFQKENRFNRHAKQLYFYICPLLLKIKITKPPIPQLHQLSNKNNANQYLISYARRAPDGDELFYWNWGGKIRYNFFSINKL